MFGNKYHVGDPLGNRIYAWEDGCMLAKLDICSMGLVRSMVRRACRYYRVKPPQVVPLNAKCRTSFYVAEDNRICFIPSHRNPVVVLHEAAHCICDTVFGSKLPDHDRKWFSIYTWLLLKFNVYERPFLAASLAPYKLQLRPRAPVRK